MLISDHKGWYKRSHDLWKKVQNLHETGANTLEWASNLEAWMGMSGLESAAADVQVSLKSYARTGTPHHRFVLISYFQKPLH